MSIPPNPSRTSRPVSASAPKDKAEAAATGKAPGPVEGKTPDAPAPPIADGYAQAQQRPEQRPRAKLGESKLAGADAFKKKASGAKAVQAAPAPPPGTDSDPWCRSPSAPDQASASGQPPGAGAVLAAGVANPGSVPAGPTRPIWDPWASGAAKAAPEAAEAAEGAEAAATASRILPAIGTAAVVVVGLAYPSAIGTDQGNPITGQPWPAGTWPKPMPELVEDWRKAGLLDSGKTGLPAFPPLPPGTGPMQEYDWTRKLSAPQQAYLRDLYSQVQAGLKPEDATNWPEVRSHIGKPIADGAPKGYTPYNCEGRTFLRRNDGDSDKYAKLTVDENGLIQPGDPDRISQPGALTRELNKVLGPPPLHHQAHHVVPDAIVRDHDLFKAARALGKPPYDLDTFENGTRLADAPQYRVAESKGLPIHSGCHPEYSKITKRIADQELAKLVKQYGSLDKVPPEKLTEAALNVQQQMREVLNTWTKLHGDKLF